MSKLTITFTEEHIKLIKCLRFRPIEVRHEKSELTKYTNYIRKRLDDLPIKSDYALLIRDIESRLNSIDRASKLSKAYADEDYDKYYGLDTYDLFETDYWYDYMARIIGVSNQVIKGTEADTDGPKYPEAVIDHLRELDDFLITNLVAIEDILHQFCDRGGIKAGVKYVSYDYEGIWYTEEDWKKIGRR